MDYLQFASQALASGVGIAGLMLSAFHVKNANTVANDAVNTLSDAIAAMHGNLTDILPRLVAASPVLLADGVKLAKDFSAHASASGGAGSAPAPTPVESLVKT